MSVRGVVSATLLSLLNGTPGSARQAQPAEFGSGITVVSLPVFVTDRDGRAISRLGEDDFEIRDDGKKVEIVGFREIDAADPDPPAGRDTSPAARRQFLLLFDLAFTSPGGLLRSREAALRFVDDLGPRDLAAVATFSAAHGIRLLVGFTTDRAQLRRAVQTLGVLELARVVDPLGLAYDMQLDSQVFADTIPGESGNLVDDAIRAIQIRFDMTQAAERRQRILALLDGMERLAAALDALQGRKQVIFLSSGFEDTVLAGADGDQRIRDSEALSRGITWEVTGENRFGDSQIRHEMTEALRRYSTSDSVIHSVDLTGLAADSDPRRDLNQPRQLSARESLSYIAGAGGGRFFGNTNDIGDAFDAILEMSRRYYLIAFEPPETKGPGRFHELEVKVSRRGARVSHRGGYFERAAYEDRSPLEKRFEIAELVAKGVTGGEIEVSTLALPYRDAEGRSTLRVVLEVPGGSLLEGRDPARPLGLEIYGYAIDEEGGIADLVALASNLSVETQRDRLRDTGLQCHAVFTLPPGRHELRFVVRDADTGRTGTRWLEVRMPGFDDAGGGLLLFPPIFVDEPERWVVIEGQSRASASTETPFRIAESAFTPRASPRLVNGREESVVLLAYDGGARYDPGASFEIAPQLLDTRGQPADIGPVRLRRSTAEANGFRRFLLSFTPEGVSPGEYTFRIRFRDPASAQVSESFQSVRVDPRPTGP